MFHLYDDVFLCIREPGELGRICGSIHARQQNTCTPHDQQSTVISPPVRTTTGVQASIRRRSPPPTGTVLFHFADQFQKETAKAKTSLEKSQRRYKSKFDKRFCKAHNLEKVGLLISYHFPTVSKPYSDEKSELSHV